jgi:hypothetical protein
MLVLHFALKLSRLSPIYGNRQNVPDIVILVTDGNGDISTESTIDYAISLRLQGVFVVALGIGLDADVFTLSSIVSTSTTGQTLFNAFSVADLNRNLINSIHNTLFIG